MSKYLFGEVSAYISHGVKSIHVYWSYRRTNETRPIGGFGESTFFVDGDTMYCESEYMSKDFETELLGLVYSKYGKPNWVLNDFKHGYFIRTGEESTEFIEFE